MNPKQGIIKFLLIVVVAILILLYFKVDLRGIVDKYWPLLVTWWANLTKGK